MKFYNFKQLPPPPPPPTHCVIRVFQSINPLYSLTINFLKFIKVSFIYLTIKKDCPKILLFIVCLVVMGCTSVSKKQVVQNDYQSSRSITSQNREIASSSIVFEVMKCSLARQSSLPLSDNFNLIRKAKANTKVNIRIVGEKVFTKVHINVGDGVSISTIQHIEDFMSNSPKAESVLFHWLDDEEEVVNVEGAVILERQTVRGNLFKFVFHIFGLCDNEFVALTIKGV